MLYEKRILVANGDTATLYCVAEGIPKPKIKWYKGETEVSVLVRLLLVLVTVTKFLDLL